MKKHRSFYQFVYVLDALVLGMFLLVFGRIIYKGPYNIQNHAESGQIQVGLDSVGLTCKGKPVPYSQAFTTMYTQCKDEFKADMQYLADHNIRNVRIFPAVSGFFASEKDTTPNGSIAYGEINQIYLGYLDDFLSFLATKNIHAHVMLNSTNGCASNDMKMNYFNYQLFTDNTLQQDAYINGFKEFLDHYKNNSTIISYDLFNEADEFLTDEADTSWVWKSCLAAGIKKPSLDQVKNFLHRMYTTAKSVDSLHKFTFSIGTPGKTAGGVAYDTKGFVNDIGADFYDLHAYAYPTDPNFFAVSPQAFYQNMQDFSDKPIIHGEVGFASNGATYDTINCDETYNSTAPMSTVCQQRFLQNAQDFIQLGSAHNVQQMYFATSWTFPRYVYKTYNANGTILARNASLAGQYIFDYNENLISSTPTTVGFDSYIFPCNPNLPYVSHGDTFTTQYQKCKQTLFNSIKFMGEHHVPAVRIDALVGAFITTSAPSAAGNIPVTYGEPNPQYLANFDEFLAELAKYNIKAYVRLNYMNNCDPWYTDPKITFNYQVLSDQTQQQQYLNGLKLFLDHYKNNTTITSYDMLNEINFLLSPNQIEPIETACHVNLNADIKDPMSTFLPFFTKMYQTAKSVDSKHKFTFSFAGFAPYATSIEQGYHLHDRFAPIVDFWDLHAYDKEDNTLFGDRSAFTTTAKAFYDDMAKAGYTDKSIVAGEVGLAGGLFTDSDGKTPCYDQWPTAGKTADMSTFCQQKVLEDTKNWINEAHSHRVKELYFFTTWYSNRFLYDAIDSKYNITNTVTTPAGQYIFDYNSPSASATPTNQPTVAATPTLTATPKPTATVTQIPNMPTLSLLFSVSGIGTDAAQHPSQQATIQFFDAQNHLVKSIQATAQSSNGIYTATTPLTGIPNGQYTLTVKLPNTLAKRYNQIVTLNGTSSITIPKVTVISGDITNDNIIDILDYNAFLGCYHKNPAADTTCQNADLNDDGIIDEIDLNTLLYAFAQQAGD